MGRLQASLGIVKASWGVLRKDKELMWLPVLSFCSTAVTIALFAGGFLVTGDKDPVTDQVQMTPVSYVLVFLMYLALAIITVFFNAALVSAANERMSGGDPTVGSAIGGATARFTRLLPWALISATVSMVLRSLQQRAGLLGRIAVGIAGIAWALVTFLVLPIIVIEGLSVGDAIRRSGALFKKTWGEQVVGNAAIGIVAFLALLAAMPIVVLAALTEVTPIVVAALVVGAAWLGLVLATSAAMSGIFQTALYRYASTGEVPDGFTPAQIEAAFRPR